jgi:hypothetical protein
MNQFYFRTFTPINLCPAYEDKDLFDFLTNAESCFSRTPPPMKPDGASARQPGFSKSKPTISLHDELEAAILKQKESLNRTMLEPESKWI